MNDMKNIKNLARKIMILVCLISIIYSLLSSCTTVRIPHLCDDPAYKEECDHWRAKYPRESHHNLKQAKKADLKQIQKAKGQ